MKKTLFLLIAFVASMSINAQNAKVMKVLDGETVLKTYEVKPTLKVVFEEATTGTATRTDGVEVKWIQLWANGPKFAEYNVGAENNKAEDYGGYYCWGGSVNKSTTDYNHGNSDLTGDNDTATYLWGSNWRMPTQAELQALLDNCDVTWTTIGGVNGRKFTGKVAPYNANSVFLPAAGYCYGGSVLDQGGSGGYWSSTPDGNVNVLAYNLFFNSGEQYVFDDGRSYGISVRPVLVETIK